MPKEYNTEENIKLELDKVEGLIVMMNDDREMFGFVEEDQRKYDSLLVKKAELERALETLTLENHE